MIPTTYCQKQNNSMIGGLFFGKPGEAEVAASEVFGNSLMCKNLTWIFQRL